MDDVFSKFVGFLAKSFATAALFLVGVLVIAFLLALIGRVVAW